MVVPGPTARVGCRPPAPFGWGSRTRRRDLWRPLSLRDRLRVGSVPRVRAHHPSFVRGVTSHVARTPLAATRLEVTPSLSSGRLPSVRFSTLRPSEEIRGPCYVRAKLLAPLSPEPFAPSSSRTCRRPVLARVSSVHLAAPLGGLVQDASHRPLQSTDDTSTRGSLDYRARGFRRADPR